jgi:hypothetical protein
MGISTRLRSRVADFVAWTKKDDNLKSLQLYGAWFLITVVMAVLLIEGIRVAGLFVIPFAFGVLSVMAGIVLAFGVAGWLLLRLLPVLIRFLVQAKPGQPLTIYDMVIGTTVAIFLGVPALFDSVKWWQEYVFTRISGEDVMVASALAMVRDWYASQGEAAFSILVLIAFSTFFCWLLFQKSDTNHAFVNYLASRTFTKRNWLFFAGLVCLFALTLVQLNRSETDALDVAASLELIVLVTWIIFPVLSDSWRLLAAAPALVGPAMIIGSYFHGRLAGGVVLMVWLVWLGSIIMVPWRFWFIPYWLGVGGMAIFLLVDGFYLRAPT